MQKVAIIGAGPAGLTAALELLESEKDFEILVIEETNAIGGISRTVNHNGNRMDIGGHRFFSKLKRVNEFWEKLVPFQGAPAFDDRKLNRKITVSASGPDPEKIDNVMLKRNRVSRIFYRKKFFDYPVKMNFRTIRNMGFFTTISSGFSYIASCIKKLPDTSLENFYINRFGKKLYSMFFEGYTEKLWGRHPREISADWGAQRVKGLSIAAVLKDIFSKLLPKKNRNVETSLIEEFFYPKFGPGQLWELCAEKIQNAGGKILMNSKVVKLNLNKSKNKIDSLFIKNSDGSETQIFADIFISSMPLKDLIESMNDVPNEIQKIASGLPYRDFVTVGLLLKKLNLKNETKLKTLSNIIPDCWIYVQDTGVHLGRIQIFNNWSPYMVREVEKTVWIGLEYFCAEGDGYWKMGDEEWKNFAANELAKIGIINSADEVLDFHCEKVRKAYPAYFDTYSQMSDLVQFLSGVENLYCVGRNGQHRYNNMDHSMETAFEVVENILSGAKDKSNIWNVNTEQEYHEEKK